MKNERKSYVVHLAGGKMTIVKAASRLLAERWGRQTYGSYMLESVEEATQKDVDWTLSMGGRIHDS